MKLQRATLLGVRGLRDADLDFTDPATGAPHEVVVVSGAPASGKTRFLEAIVAAKEAIAPYGPKLWPDPWIADGVAAKVVLAFYLDPEERVFAGVSGPVMEAEARFVRGRAESLADDGLRALLGRYTHAGKMGKVEYFAASRAIPTHPAQTDLGAEAQRPLRPTKGPYKYSFIYECMEQLAQRPRTAALFAEILAALSPTCRYDLGPRVGLSSRGEPRASVNELSDSERDAALFAATALVIDLHCSIVLIDRPDLFVDAERGGALLAGLRALGEDNQLILAPRSPEVFASTKGACVVALEGL